MNYNLVFAFFVTVDILNVAKAYKILGMFPLPVRSHITMYHTLMKGLAEKGHEVDLFGCFPPDEAIPGLNHFEIKGVFDALKENFSLTDIRETMSSSFETVRLITDDLGYNVCEKTFESFAASQLKTTSKKYDVLITEIFSTDCMLGFAHHFKIPFIGMTSSVNLPWASDRIGTIDNPSYIPTYFSTFTSKMNFFERLYNTVTLQIFKYLYDSSIDKSNQMARNFFGPDLPDLRELAKRTSLVLVNSHPSINFARPTNPNFVEVGGLHIKSPKALPEHLEKAMSHPGQKGVIYFSMGSFVMSETFSVSVLQSMMDTFAELPLYKVIWKAPPKKLPQELHVPANVEFHEWLPQMDILCHKNVKLFISHGGLMGSQEAIYCGIPRLGIPLFADQELNLKLSDALNISITVKYDDITKKTFSVAVNSLLNDPKYRENNDRISGLFKDRPMTPLNTAIFWVEYVVRSKGALHLRPVGSDLPWYQYYLVDVITFMVFSVIFVLFLLYNTLCAIFRFMLKRKSKRD